MLRPEPAIKHFIHTLEGRGSQDAQTKGFSSVSLWFLTWFSFPREMGVGGSQMPCTRDRHIHCLHPSSGQPSLSHWLALPGHRNPASASISNLNATSKVCGVGHEQVNRDLHFQHPGKATFPRILAFPNFRADLTFCVSHFLLRQRSENP